MIIFCFLNSEVIGPRIRLLDLVQLTYWCIDSQRERRRYEPATALAGAYHGYPSPREGLWWFPAPAQNFGDVGVEIDRWRT
jgi:hypothetical protein